jgi:tryptophan-rich sensory protein
MQELEATWGRAVSVWWLIQWRAIAGGLVTGGVLGAVLGVALAFTDWDSSRASPFYLVIGAVLGIVWTVIAVRMALRKKYRDFRIVLLPPDSAT